MQTVDPNSSIGRIRIRRIRMLESAHVTAANEVGQTSPCLAAALSVTHLTKLVFSS